MTFRAIQGAGGAIMFPAALAIVVQTFELRERGRALALFFGIAGGLTAIGPILGGYLTEWTWRAIFWVNIPVAVIALVLIAVSKPTTEYRPARMDYRGLVLIAGGVGLSVFGFQQSSIWGWGNPGIGSVHRRRRDAAGRVPVVEMRTASPLIQVGIFRIRAFLVENLVLGIAMLVFVPVFFFASEYAQIALGKSAQGPVSTCCTSSSVSSSPPKSAAGCSTGGERSARWCSGCALAAVGFSLWAGKVTELDFGSQIWYVMIAGAGMGFMLGPANTDAVNRASRLSYGEATGITQTVRNYAASLGLAILGTVLVTGLRSRLTARWSPKGCPQPGRDAKRPGSPSPTAAAGASPRSRISCGSTSPTPPAPCSTSWPAIMAGAAVVAMLGLEPGRQQDPAEAVVEGGVQQ